MSSEQLQINFEYKVLKKKWWSMQGLVANRSTTLVVIEFGHSSSYHGHSSSYLGRSSPISGSFVYNTEKVECAFDF